jgi:hypothetical protein
MTPEIDKPYVTTFVGQVCVEAQTQEEAEKKAVAWGMRKLTESVTVTPGAAVVRPCGRGQLAVPLTGTINFIGPSQAAVDEKVRTLLETVREEGPSLGVAMGDFRIVPQFETNDQEPPKDRLV